MSFHIVGALSGWLQVKPVVVSAWGNQCQVANMFSREHAIRCSALAEGLRDIRSIFTCEGACHSPACQAASTPVLCQGMRLGWICNKPHEINAATNSRICRSGLPFRKVCFSVGGLPSGQGTKHFGRAAFYEFHSLLVRALCEQRRELP